MEVLAASFAYHRILGQIYAELENVFSGYPENLSFVEQLFYDGERLGGDLIKSINGEELNQNIVDTGILNAGNLPENEELVVENQNSGIQNWQIPEILKDGGLIEYLPNNAFSFFPSICYQLKQLNLELIKETIGNVKKIIKAAKEVSDQQFEIKNELNELRATAAIINKRLLLYYADRSTGNKQELLVNLKKFFEVKTIDFYAELLNIAHPTLTKYLFSSAIKEQINQKIIAVNQNTGKEQLKDTITQTVNELISKLEQIHCEQKADELGSFKRRAEIIDLLKNFLLEKNLSNANREYLLSANFTEDVNQLIDVQIDQQVNIDEDNNNEQAEDSDLQQEIASQNDEQEYIAHRVNEQMQELRESLKYFQSSIIDYVHLIMANYQPMLLKSILEDEKTIKLEKYLLLSKKYFPVFKRMFPEIGTYELGVIAKHCMPSFQQLTLTGILPIFANKTIWIIGDGELHSSTILNDELIKLKHPVRHLAIGFGYSSVISSFPLIFPEEVEHMPKYDVEMGIKFYNSKGGYLLEKLENNITHKHFINSKYLDSDELVRFINEKKYLATKEVSDILSTPYTSGWININLLGQIKQDIDFTFIVDQPYPATILKMYAKAKILPNYKGNI